MSKYIIRLDDACPTMNHNNWKRMEELLDKYSVRPIVGVIPDNTDTDFSWDIDENFWTKVKNWQKKGWEISLHGYNHKLHHPQVKNYFQKSHGNNTEFAGVSYDDQFEMISKGIEKFNKYGISEVRSFFAPAHTYDFNTVEVLKKMKFRFISDGYALKPYKKSGMIFVPSICDGPYKFIGGIYTFVFHPSMMSDKKFLVLEKFLKENKNSIVSVEAVITNVKDRQGIIGRMIENGIYLVRGIRKALK